MSCDRATVLHGYFDNELGALDAAEFESHLEHCTECIASLEAMESLRSSINRAQLYEKAPGSLRKNVAADLGFTSRFVTTPWRWLAIAAMFLLCAFIGWQFVAARPGGSQETFMAAELVDAHLRSLQPGHLMDVVSSDQHTVKPWFAGKLDFSPPVRDFADRGFPLQGGRLEIIHGRAGAALIYGRRKHLVNVFVWPARESDRLPHSGSRQGYQWVDWRKGGMEFCVVSDASAAELEKLEGLFTE